MSAIPGIMPDPFRSISLRAWSETYKHESEQLEELAAQIKCIPMRDKTLAQSIPKWDIKPIENKRFK